MWLVLLHAVSVDDALVGLVVHKRHGCGDPMRQWVSMTVGDLVAILTGYKAGLE